MFRASNACHNRIENKAGFTLAELLVASTLLTIIMAAVYTAFSNTILTWQRGESGVDVYQTARQSLALLTRELQSPLPDSHVYMEGTNRSLSFFTLSRPQDVTKGAGEHAVYVSYSIVQGQFIREEAVLDGPLPPLEYGDRTLRMPKLDLGRRFRTPLSDRIENIQFEYVWALPPQRPENSPPVLQRPIVADRHRLGWGQPQGLRIHLVVEDDAAPSGRNVFSSYISYRSPQSAIPEPLRPRVGGRQQ